MVCCGMRGADNTAHYGVYQSPCTDHCEELRQQEEELVAVRLRGRALQREYRKAGFDNGNNEEVCIYIGWIITAPLMGCVEYCDECVCLSVSLSVCLSVRGHVSGTTRPVFTKFFVHVTYGRGSVISAHKPTGCDVAARLRQRGSHVRSLGLGARRNTRCRQRTLWTTSCSQDLLGHSGRVEYS